VPDYRQWNKESEEFDGLTREWTFNDLYPECIGLPKPQGLLGDQRQAPRALPRELPTAEPFEMLPEWLPPWITDRDRDLSKGPDPQLIEERLSSVRRTAVYRRMSGNSCFRFAAIRFSDKAWPDPFAELRFLGAVGRAFERARFFKLWPPARMGTPPDRRTFRAAAGYIEKLQACMRKGVRLDDVLEGSRLAASLAALSLQIEVKMTARLPRQDETASARLVTTQLIDDFLQAFGNPLDEIVAELAPIVGYDSGVDPRTIEKLAAVRRRVASKRRQSGG